MDELYQDIILENYHHPYHYGVIKSPTNDLSADNPLCGDSLRITVTMKNHTLTDIGFTSQSCAIATASMSILTDRIIGKTSDDIKHISPEDFLKILAIPLSPARMKCALLGYNTVQRILVNEEEEIGVSEVGRERKNS